MDYFFEHIRNSESKSKNYLVESCIGQIESFTNKKEYSILESMLPLEREVYVMETLNIIDYHNVKQLKRLNNAGRKILQSKDVWKLVIDIPFPEINLDKIVYEANQRNRVRLARSLRHIH